MIYHLITSPECNLCCEYCCGKSFSEPPTKIEFESLPLLPTYTQAQLNSFLKKDEKKPVSLIFYGGEPLLNIEFIKQTMNAQKKYKTVNHFLLQTNATLLNELPKNYVNKFHTILVSIDGGKQITNKNRGEGTWEKVITNIELIKKNGYKNELIARMTIEEPTNFFDDIMQLIKPTQTKISFTSIHWQLDANMWHDYEKRNFEEWSKQYNKDVTKLVNYWVNELKKGKVIRLYPFIGILNSLLFEEKYYLRCGSGIENFTILSNGKISACPIMQGIKEKYLGDIKTTQPQELPLKLTCKEPCLSCEEYELCGGRCLYSNIYPAWPKKGVKEICKTTKHLISEMKRIKPIIEELIKKKVIKKKDFAFLKYNCCEIIP